MKFTDDETTNLAPVAQSHTLAWSNPTHLAFLGDSDTPEILLEGSLGCGKTTAALDKEIDALLKWPGIPILLFRWTEDAVTTKLKPAFDELLSLRGVSADWDAKQKIYTFENGSRAWMFGLKAVSQIELFNKIRGLGVCRIMGDQVEEMDRTVAGELRGRLRPDLTATLKGLRFPFQLTFVANPSDQDFWLSKEFPIDNRVKGRRLYSLSVFDNPFLPKETIDSLLRQYPPDHPKHLTMVLGQRGPNIDGDPIFEGLYRKELHWRPILLRPSTPILEAFFFGTHNPTWIFGQKQYGDGLALLGGIRGEGLMLEDFLTVVDSYRKDWYPPNAPVQTCVAPMGDQQSTQPRFTGLNVLRKRLNVTPLSRANGNAADVRAAMVELIATFLRRRNVNGQEAFGVNNDPAKFLIANSDGPRESAFLHHACEAGAVWDKHFVSVGNKEVRRLHEDDKFANAMHAVEDICLNFLAGRLTDEEQAAKRAQQRQQHGPSSPPLTGEAAWAV